jgi:ornithine cyclodeaminase/alanine dehydrogenase-like protein (mu-crystallin family)
LRFPEATVAAIDGRSGVPMAVLDGPSESSLRTGAGNRRVIESERDSIRA